MSYVLVPFLYISFKNITNIKDITDINNAIFSNIMALQAMLFVSGKLFEILFTSSFLKRIFAFDLAVIIDLKNNSIGKCVGKKVINSIEWIRYEIWLH